MAIPTPDHQCVYVRNFFTIFICVSLTAYVHYQMKIATSPIEDTNQIVTSILRKQNFTISQQRLNDLSLSLKVKPYQQLSQGQCLVKIYLDVLRNQKFLHAEANQKNKNDDEQTNDDTVELDFSELVFPSDIHDLVGFRNCSDIITLLNYLNPTKTDLIYSTFMQQKYGLFVDESQTQFKPQPEDKTNGFCIMSHQTNTSRTKLRDNIKSLIDQSYENYRMIILDGGSTDGSYEIAKVILSDFKEKLIKENKEQQKQIESKYQIIKEENKLGVWELVAKYQNKCQGMNYLLVIDGRDELVSRHTLSILNRNIHSSKQAPAIITSSILKRKQLSRQNSISIQQLNNTNLIPSFTFKVISLDLFNQLNEKIIEKTKLLNHSFEVEKTVIETLFSYCLSNNKSILNIDQMLYVYDTIENKELDRNEYFIATVKKQLEKKNPKGIPTK